MADATPAQADAQFELATCYAHGQGVPQDDREAARLYRLAAEQGHYGAQFALAMSCSLGQGVPMDWREAACLLRLSADQGYAGAQYYLGSILVGGKGGVPQDEREGVRLWRLAAEQDFAFAQLKLGRLLLEGSAAPAVPRQPKDGALLLARAAQPTEDAGAQQRALACLSAHAHERDVVQACCIGCGKTKQLKLCGTCRVAKWCGPECAKRMWPVHKACCKEWAGAPGAAGATA